MNDSSPLDLCEKLITFHVQIGTPRPGEGLPSFTWGFRTQVCAAPCPPGAAGRTERQGGRPVFPAPTLLGETLRLAGQNVCLTQQDRIVGITGHPSSESVELGGTGCPSHLSAVSPPEAAPLSKRVGAKGEGHLGSSPQARNLVPGSSRWFPFLSSGCRALSIFYGTADVSELPWRLTPS